MTLKLKRKIGNIKVVNLPQKKNKWIANLLMENENMNKIKVNPLNGDVSDSQLNARGGQNDHALKYI